MKKEKEKKILKLDISKQTGWAITSEGWYKKKGKIFGFGTKSFWLKNEKVPKPGEKIESMFNFIIELHKQYQFDFIIIEQLNYFRNAKAVRSLIQQQSGAYYAALRLGVPMSEIHTRLSYRKQKAKDMLTERNIEVSNLDEADALMLGENLDWDFIIY